MLNIIGQTYIMSKFVTTYLDGKSSLNSIAICALKTGVKNFKILDLTI